MLYSKISTKQTSRHSTTERTSAWRYKTGHSVRENIRRPTVLCENANLLGVAHHSVNIFSSARHMGHLAARSVDLEVSGAGQSQVPRRRAREARQVHVVNVELHLIRELGCLQCFRRVSPHVIGMFLCVEVNARTSKMSTVNRLC